MQKYIMDLRPTRTGMDRIRGVAFASFKWGSGQYTNFHQKIFKESLRKNTANKKDGQQILSLTPQVFLFRKFNIILPKISDFGFMNLYFSKIHAMTATAAATTMPPCSWPFHKFSRTDWRNTARRKKLRPKSQFPAEQDIFPYREQMRPKEPWL